MPTVDEIFTKFKKEKLPKLAPRTRIDYVRLMNQLSEAFGRRDPVNLPLKELNVWIKSGPAQQRNKQMACLSSTFGAAVKWGWIDYNVCKEVERNPKEARTRIVTEKEFKMVQSKTKSVRLALAMDLAWHTGLLQQTMRNLRWDQVYENESLIRVRHHLTDAAIEIEITPELKDVLFRLKQLPTEKKSQFVLCNRRGEHYTGEGFRAMWQRNMTKHVAGANDRFTFNDIKKTYDNRHKKATASMGPSVSDLFEGYPQFPALLRKQAAEMAPYYQVFYCLEQSIRNLVADTLQSAAGVNWWNSDKIRQDVRAEALALYNKELDSGRRVRSPRMIDYTTFGQLNSIMMQNWNLFGRMFKSKNAVGTILAGLNIQRGPIAHCSLLLPDEIERFKLLMRDWFQNLIKPLAGMH